MKNKKLLAKILNGLGLVIVIVVLGLLLPLTVPKVFGYEIYGILSDSMEPEIKTGSIVFVKEVNSDIIQVGDIITYKMGADSDVVATHRVVEIDDENEEFITKGDHNQTIDASPISYDRLLGRVEGSIPYWGAISLFIHSSTGLACIIIGFSISIFCWIFADSIQRKLKKEK
ncbi:MAG: signal peptidase I [Clostridium sp.]